MGVDGTMGDGSLTWVPSSHIKSGWVGVSHIEYARRLFGRISGLKRNIGVTCDGLLSIADIPVSMSISFAFGARCFLSAPEQARV